MVSDAQKDFLGHPKANSLHQPWGTFNSDIHSLLIGFLGLSPHDNIYWVFQVEDLRTIFDSSLSQTLHPKSQQVQLI